MPDDAGNIYLFEALELRGEFDGRIKTVKESLPESRSGIDGSSVLRWASDTGNTVPATDVDVAALRAEMKALEYKRRKLNAAIQEANFRNSVSVEGESLSLAEALDLRKATRDSIGELHRRTTSAAFVRVIHKEDRDIRDEPLFSFTEVLGELNQARRTFRALNRALRQASFQVAIAFRDEPIGG
ncbi:MAG: hypothetical protein PF508_09950 [Spirochaeta sp.]|nr:hypothetical protein [Spirochaeta sp.]